MSSALVVSGGGTKGAFEVGALEYLSRKADFYPRIMAGTSAGSLICAPLAQAANAEQFKELVGVVRSNCLAITKITDMFAREPWLDEISDTPVGTFIAELISVRSRPPLAADPEDVSGSLTSADRPMKHHTLFTVGRTVAKSGELVKASKYLRESPTAIMNLDPTEAGYRGQRSGGVAPIDEERIASSGVTLRVTVTSLTDGVGRYVTEKGSMVAADAVTPYEAGGTPGVIEGICASSSVPIVFPPRRIGDCIYVDGGIVQNTPLSAALSCGAKDVIVLLASSRTMTRDETDYTKSSFLTIYSRAAQDITARELERVSLSSPTTRSSVTFVEPTVNVLGLFEIEAALLKIDFDYGWLRAAEAMAELTSEERQALGAASDAIIQQRERAWFAEERILECGPEADLVGSLRRSRQRVVESVAIWEPYGLPQPKNMKRWGHTWEEHDQQIPDALQDVAVV